MSIQGEFFETPTAVIQEVLEDRTSTEDTSTEEVTSVVLEDVPSPTEHRAVKTDTPPRGKLTMKDLSIPKLYYSISEVSRLTGIEPYVLRYWESEFHELKPQKNRAGNRTYSNRDIKFILRIKDLLREKRYTIEGAKHIIHAERNTIDSKEETASTTVSDPAQIAMPTETKAPAAPQAFLTLAEIKTMKESLSALKSVLLKH